MPRKSKDPKVRRDEFISTAEILFEEKGYENTSVDDIVKRMGVAKGLFYYYFETKDDVLDIIIDRLLDDTRRAMEEVAERPGLDTIARLQAMSLSRVPLNSKYSKLIDYFHEEKNKQLHFSIESRGMEFFIPVMEKIVRQGIREGIFKPKYPHEAAVIYLLTATAMGHEGQKSLKESDWKALRQKVGIFEHFAEKILDARPGTFSYLRDFVSKEIRRRRQAMRGSRREK